MIKTFDFVFDALRSERLMKQLKNALECDANLEICTDIERLYFDSRHKTVTIKPYSATSAFHWKVAPAEITYDTLSNMLSDNWENIKQEDIRYL